ncbi:MAG TPA: hypothetical protein VE890_02240 [Thermoguttaceae bacterium]|nr:hypothetical protein [Thermoguttaceae bacterium]
MRTLDQLRKDGKIDLLETVRLSALEGHESMVRFGKLTTVTVAVQGIGQGRTVRRTDSRDVGTLVRLTARPEGEAILLTLQYEASRLDGPGQEDAPPDTGTVGVTTTMLIEPGQPTLAGSCRSDKTTLLIVSIEK